VQVIPHVTTEIKPRTARRNRRRWNTADVVIGRKNRGTVGDIESLPSRSDSPDASRDLGRENSLFVHDTLVP